eukprot:454127-Prorocentrum_minimum.AAC.3
MTIELRRGGGEKARLGQLNQGTRLLGVRRPVHASLTRGIPFRIDGIGSGESQNLRVYDSGHPGLKSPQGSVRKVKEAFDKRLIKSRLNPNSKLPKEEKSGFLVLDAHAPAVWWRYET